MNCPGLRPKPRHEWKENLLHFEDGQAMEQVSQSVCVAFIFGGSKIQLGKALSNLICPHSRPCLEKEVGLETFQGPLQFVLSYDFFFFFFFLSPTYRKIVREML